MSEWNSVLDYPWHNKQHGRHSSQTQAFALKEDGYEGSTDAVQGTARGTDHQHEITRGTLLLIRRPEEPVNFKKIGKPPVAMLRFGLTRKFQDI